MSIYFCTDCKDAFIPEETKTDGEQLFCKKCSATLINLGSENGKVSLRAHLQSKNHIKSRELYHDYSLISSKNYDAPKKDPILIECESKLTINPLDTDALYTLSQWYYAHGLVTEAIAIAKQIIKINSEHANANAFIARVNAVGQTATLPEDLPTLEGMGYNLMKAKNYGQAEIIFKKILQLNSKHAAAQRYLAEIYTEKNNSLM